MKLHKLSRLYLTLCLSIWSAGNTIGQDQIPTASLSPQTYNSGTHKWRRPPEVKFVLLTGCGGGGGGMAFDASPDGSIGISGTASKVITLVIPVQGDIYDIVIGNGGSFSLTATNTTFSGEGVGTISLGGASAPFQNLGFDYPNMRGEASPFGPGGKFLEYATVPTLGVTNAQTKCAGGGGALGRWLGTTDGRGGSGFLTVVPLPDMDRFSRVLGVIEELNAPPPNTPEPVKPPAETPPENTTPTPVVTP